MVVAILLLILFAVLFPKVLRFLIIVTILAIGVAASHAKPTSDFATRTVTAWKLAAGQCNGTSSFKGPACTRLESIEAKLVAHGCMVNMAMWWCPLTQGEGARRECSHFENDAQLMCPILPGKRSP